MTKVDNDALKNYLWIETPPQTPNFIAINNSKLYSKFAPKDFPCLSKDPPKTGRLQNLAVLVCL